MFDNTSNESGAWIVIAKVALSSILTHRWVTNYEVILKYERGSSKHGNALLASVDSNWVTASQFTLLFESMYIWGEVNSALELYALSQCVKYLWKNYDRSLSAHRSKFQQRRCVACTIVVIQSEITIQLHQMLLVKELTLPGINLYANRMNANSCWVSKDTLYSIGAWVRELVIYDRQLLLASTYLIALTWSSFSPSFSIHVSWNSSSAALMTTMSDASNIWQ